MNGTVHRFASDLSPETEESREKAKAEAKRQAKIERRDIEKKRRAADEKLKWRTWTFSEGTKTNAKFSGVIAGTVKLTKTDGSVLKIPLGELSAEDQDWIANRRK